MSTAIAERKAPELPEPVARRGITEGQWRTLMNSLYPGAKGESVLLVWDYCQARKLDPLKKPCHIVPIDVKVGDRYEKRDVVMPGIYELRTTAQRTGEYLGHSTPVYGEEIAIGNVKAPSWCSMTFYRYHPDAAGNRVDYPVTTFFREVVATNRDGAPNARWTKAPIQMLTKCCEAAGLREAFPDELGGEQTVEEMDGQRHIDAGPIVEVALPPAPEGFEAWLADMAAVADEGEAKLADAWQHSPQATREYLASIDPGGWDRLKARAAAVDADAKEPE